MTSGPLPLAGLRLLVTRREEQARELVDGLIRLGATVVAVPLIETRPPDDPGPLDAALARLESYDWLAFTSANAVNAVRARLEELGVALPHGLRLASVGRATSSACAALLGRAPDLEPESDFRAEGLVSAFARAGPRPFRVLVPCSNRARDTLPLGLRGLGGEVDVVVAYHTEWPEGARERLRQSLGEGLDLVLFASPSAVDGFVAAVGEKGRRIPVAVIGSTTAAAAHAAGLEVRITAPGPTTEELLSALVRHYAAERPRESRTRPSQ